jgi:hypothetical protein
MNSRFVKFATVATVAVAVLAGCQSNQPRYANYDPQPRYSDREGPRTVNYGPNEVIPQGYRSVEFGTVEDVQYVGGGGSTSGAWSAASSVASLVIKQAAHAALAMRQPSAACCLVPSSATKSNAINAAAAALNTASFVCV